MELIEKLRNVRRQLEISQGELGNRLGITQAHLSDIEKGKVSPRLSSVTEIARALDHELILVPRDMLPMLNAMLAGKNDAPLWQVKDDEGNEA